METELSEDNLNKLYSLLSDLTTDDAFCAFINRAHTNLDISDVEELMDVVNQFQAEQFPAPEFDTEED